MTVTSKKRMMTSIITRLALVLFSCLTLTIPAHSQQRLSSDEDIVELDRIIAQVNDDIVMESEMIRRMRKVNHELLDKGIPPPPLHILEKQVLERLIIHRLQIKEAERAGIVVEDQTLNRTLQKIAETNNLTLQQFRRLLERDGISFSQFREEIRDEIMISRIRNRAVNERIRITEQEIDHLLENLLNSGELDSQYHLGHILIAVPEDAGNIPSSYREKAEKVISELNSGKDFKQVAAAYSDAQTALEGGDLGWRKRAELPSAFIDIVPGLQPGQVSDIIEAPGGLHIIKLFQVRGDDRKVISQTRVRHILVKPSEVLSDTDAQSRVEGYYNRILSGEDFASIARANSDDTASAVEGGDLGWVAPESLAPEFEEAMNNTPVGSVSKPFRSRYGWHVLKVEDRREYDSTEEYRRNRAREAIRKRKIEEETELWVRRLRDEAYIEFKLDQADS